MVAKSEFFEKTKKKNLIYKGKSVNFRSDEILLPNGKTAVREFIEHPGAVAVLARDSSGKIIFVRQYRYPVGKETLEIPAGKFNSKNDDPIKRALSELKEETGYRAKYLEHLVDYWPTPAFSDEVLRIYLAYGLKKGKRFPDEDEFLSTVKLTLRQAFSLIKRGRIKDSKTIIAILYYIVYKGAKL